MPSCQQIVHFEAQIAKILALTNWMSRKGSHLINSFGGLAARLTEMEHNFSAFTARMCRVETGVAPVSNVPALLLDLGRHQDKEMAPQPWGPVTPVRRMKAEGRLDIDKGPDDENSRSAVLPRFPCEQCLPGMHAWLTETIAPTDQPERAAANEEVNQLASCLNKEPNVKTLLQDARMMAFHIRPTVLSVTPRLQFLFASPDLQNCERSDWNSFGSTYCNKMKQVLRPRIARPVYGGRPFASSPFRRLVSRGLLFPCGALILRPLQVAIFIYKRQILNDHVPH